MKRESITAIVAKAMMLNATNFSYSQQMKKLSIDKQADNYSRFGEKICIAATNEIIRLEAETELAAEKATPKLFNQFNQIDNEQAD